MIDQNGSNNTFTFSHVTMNDVLKELRSINIRKTTGCDLIPGKLIKEGADFLCKPIQSLINKCIDTCTFPNALKLADVVPIFKKNDMLSCIVLYCIMRPYTDGRLDRYRIGVPREMSEIRTQPWLSEGSLTCDPYHHRGPIF